MFEYAADTELGGHTLSRSPVVTKASAFIMEAKLAASKYLEAS